MEQMRTICKNPWCRATFFYKEQDMIILSNDSINSKIENVLGEEPQKSPPNICPKCKSFDTELSSGVEWKDKEYEGSRFDGLPHQLKYKVTNYK